MILLIVFLPLLAAVIAGLGNRLLGNTVAKVLTTGALFASCLLSWLIFFHYLGGGEPTIAPMFDWIHSGDLQVAWALRVDALTAVMLVVITS
ncbi:MAG: NADH-quinone oxidoreductase subunit L, partial [Sphingomonas sp.]